MIKTREQAIALAQASGVSDKVVLFGYRSQPSHYGEYDDVLAILTPDAYQEFRGNTLPSIDRQGTAVLPPGVYKYRQGIHGISHLNMASAVDKEIYAWLLANKGKDYPTTVKDSQGNIRILPYWAFRQGGPVKILRIGAQTPALDAWPTNPAWIDIHKGGYNLTSSLGCQTKFPDTWLQFRALGFSEMDKYAQETIEYILELEPVAA
jgi:hypothetical protein